MHALEQSAAEAQRTLQAVAAERDAANATRLQAEDRAAKLQLEIQVSRHHFAGHYTALLDLLAV